MQEAIQKPGRTPPETLKKIDAMFAAAHERVAYLCDRWSDEAEYEDWSDYVAEFRKLLPEGFTLVGATKRPFGFTFTVAEFPGALYFVRATATTAAWGRS